MILPFEHYIKEGKVQKQLPDINKEHASMNKAERRIKFLQEINEENAEFVFEDIYEAIREAPQSLMALKGYKPISHEAVIAFIRDKAKIDYSTVSKFNSYRKLRNKSVYEAEKIYVIRTNESKIFAKKLINKLKSILIIQR